MIYVLSIDVIEMLRPSKYLIEALFYHSKFSNSIKSSIFNCTILFSSKFPFI